MKKVIAIFLSFILILGVLPAHAEYVVTGGGAAIKVQEISTAEELYALSAAAGRGECGLYSYVKLTADIDLSAYPNFPPIGTPEHPFSGNFDGGGHTVSGLTFVDEEAEYVGLFGYAKDATIRNVFLKDSYLCGFNFTGGILGYAAGGVTLECVSSGAKVKGRRYVGGIVGMISPSATLSECENREEVIGYNSVGGIAGAVHSEGTTMISDCRNTAQISGGNFNLGGIVGENYGADTSVVTRCVNTGTIKRGGDGYHVGSLVGFNYGKNERSIALLSDSYYLMDTSPFGCGHEGSYSMVADINLATPMMLSTDVGLSHLDFKTVWEIKDGIPALRRLSLMEEGEIALYIDGTFTPMKQNPIIKNDRTYLPMRALFEALGATVSWDGAARTATAVREGKPVVFTIDSPVVRMDGEAITYDSAPFIEDDRTFIPVRAAAESLGATVTWHEHPRRVEIVLEK